jgi:hypothetical protein
VHIRIVGAPELAAFAVLPCQAPDGEDILKTDRATAKQLLLQTLFKPIREMPLRLSRKLDRTRLYEIARKLLQHLFPDRQSSH